MVVRDYFKSVNTDILSWTKIADEIIRWLRSRPYLLALLREVQLSLPTHRPGELPLSVVRGVLTRWTSIYLAYRRLLRLRTALMVFIEDSRLFDSGTPESHAKTRQMVDELRKPLLWHHLSR